MKDAQGNSYVIEVNGNPGSKIIVIKGHNYFNDLVKYAAQKGKIKNTISAILDDNNSGFNSGYADARAGKGMQYYGSNAYGEY